VPTIRTISRRSAAQSEPVVELRNLAPFLRGVVFVGEATLCEGFDFQRIGLRPEGGGD
jgi:hypothetical protein